MKSLLKIGGIVIGLAIAVYILSIWYSVFIVGRYYENGGVLNNVLVGGVPLWLLFAVYGIYKGVKWVASGDWKNLEY